MTTTSNHTSSTIERDSVEAVYQQLARHLIEEMKEFKPGERFHTEEDIMERYEISRTTVRRAVQLLVDRGLVVRRQGKGTFVTGSRPIQSANRLAPFVESFTMAGIQPTVRLFAFTWVSDPDEFPDSIRDRSDAFLLARRSYESEGTPLAVAEIYLPRHIGALITLTDLEQHPVYQVLQDRVGVRPSSAQLRVTLQEPPERITTMLDVDSLPFVPRLERVTEGSDGAFLEYMQAYIHPDAFEMVADIEAAVPSEIAYTFKTEATGKPL